MPASSLRYLSNNTYQNCRKKSVREKYIAEVADLETELKKYGFKVEVYGRQNIFFDIQENDR